MSVYRYRKGWKAEVYCCGKRIISKSGFSTKKGATEWHNKQLVEYKPQQDIQFTELIELFKTRHLVTVTPGTARRYTLDIECRLMPCFGKGKLTDITSAHIEDFKASLLGKLSVKSANNCLSLLKIILKKAVEWDFLTVDPASNIKLQKVPQQKYQWWDKEKDIEKFLAQAQHDRYYLAYRLALDLGLRLGEIVGLSKADINLTDCSIHIHRQWLEKEKCFGPTKHGKHRIVYFTKEDALYQLLEQRLQTVDSNILVLSSTGRRLSARKLSSYFFQRVIKAADVPRIRFHDLRHTFASWFMIKQDNIWRLREILGHQDIQTTQRYAHLSTKNRAVFAASFA